MKTRRLLTVFLFSMVSVLYGQQVETIISHPKIVDGLHVDPAGNVYTASGGLVGGFEIGKYIPSTNQFNAFFANGFFGPIDIDQYQDSLLVVTNFDNNTASTYNMNTGQVSLLSSGLDGPAGIAIDSNDNIYITNFGAPPAYTGHTIQKITPQGLSYVFVDSSALLRPQAICFNGQGELIVHSSQSLYKVNFADSSLVHWVSLGVGVGNMAYRNQDSSIYACAGGNFDRIMRIDAQGIVSVFSGSTDGYQDGHISAALFSNPLGIAMSPNEDTIYISEAGTARRLRRIIMDQSTGSVTSLNQTIEIYPNPVSDYLHIRTSQHESLEIEIVDVLGNRIYATKLEQADGLLDLAGLPAGIYFVQVTGLGERITRKITKH